MEWAEAWRTWDVGQAPPLSLGFPPSTTGMVVRASLGGTSIWGGQLCTQRSAGHTEVLGFGGAPLPWHLHLQATQSGSQLEGARRWDSQGRGVKGVGGKEEGGERDAQWRPAEGPRPSAPLSPTYLPSPSRA